MLNEQKLYNINIPVDWIQGHLRYGHLEGDVYLTQKEVELLKNKDKGMLEEIKDSLSFVLDDFDVEYRGDEDYNSMSIVPINSTQIIEIRIFSKDNQDMFYPPEHYGFFTIDEAIKELQKLRGGYSND